MKSYETSSPLTTVQVLVDRHNQRWQERQADVALTPEQQGSYDAQAAYAIEGFDKITQGKQPLVSYQDVFSRVRSFEAIDMGEYFFEDRMTHIYAQPTQHIFCESGLSRYEISLCAPRSDTDVSGDLPHLGIENATILDQVSINFKKDPLQSTLQEAYAFNQFLDQVTARL